MTTTLVEAPETSAFTSYYDDHEGLDALYTETVFEVRNGELTQWP